MCTDRTLKVMTSRSADRRRSVISSLANAPLGTTILPVGLSIGRYTVPSTLIPLRADEAVIGELV